MYLVYDPLWHWERSPVAAVDASASVQPHEVISALRVTGWASSNGPYGACRHAVVMFLVCLYVLTKFDFAVRVEVKPAVEDELRRALCGGDATFDDKHVAPEDL